MYDGATMAFLAAAAIGTCFAACHEKHSGELVDERSCSECTCGDASGSCPTTEAQLFEGYYCNDATIALSASCTEACVGLDCETYAVSATVSIGAAEATCPPTGGELVGELVEQDPVTFCCTA